MYKILKNITWCGKTYLTGMFYDFKEATRPAQLKALIGKGLIEPVETAKTPESKPAEKPIPKTETRFKKQDKK